MRSGKDRDSKTESGQEVFLPLGMKLPLDAFAIRLSEGEDPVLTKKPDTIEGRFYFREYPEPERGFFAAVCSEDPDMAENLRWMTL